MGDGSHYEQGEITGSKKVGPRARVLQISHNALINALFMNVTTMSKDLGHLVT